MYNISAVCRLSLTKYCMLSYLASIQYLKVGLPGNLRRSESGTLETRVKSVEIELNSNGLVVDELTNGQT